ncbi:hypothetical protein ACFFX0_23460 [Citricoccus parietis]|uniref:Uncharacterized protein n=1 Tax=Citricoccus parietis TaxID=592307 RepID=A0ABV5G4W1_9MICC
MDWLVMSTSVSWTPKAWVTTMIEVSTSRAPAPKRNMVSPSFSAKSRVVRASASALRVVRRYGLA